MTFQKGHTLGGLKPGHWSKFHGDRCSSCGTTEEPHLAKGLCSKCYCRLNPKRNYSHEHYVMHRHRYWSKSTLTKHKAWGYVVNITVDELEDLAKSTEVCAMCGRKLNWYNSKLKIDSPTLDRRNNEKVLTMDNTWILCYRCNTVKNSLTLLELKEWCGLILPRIEKYL